MKKFTAGQLSCGLSYYLLSKPGSPVAFSIMFPGGSLVDPPGLAGLAHATEHALVYKNTVVSPMAQLLMFRKVIASNNWNIRTDYTNVAFGISGARYKHHAWKAFAFLAKCLKDRFIDQDTEKVELSAVENEILVEGQENIEYILYTHLKKTLFPKTVFGRNLDGEIKTIHLLTMEKMLNFARTYFRARNAHVIVIGPPVVEALEIVKMHFEDWSESRFLKPIRIPLAPEIQELPQGFKNKHLRHVGARAFHFCKGMYLPKLGHRDDMLIVFLAEVLEIMLFQALRNEQGLTGEGTYYPAVKLDRSAWYGFMYIWVYFARERGIQLARAAIDRLIQELQSSLVSVEIFEAARCQVLESVAQFQIDDVNELIEEMNVVLSNNLSVESLYDAKRRALHVTRQDIKRAACMYLNRGAEIAMFPA